MRRCPDRPAGGRRTSGHRSARPPGRGRVRPAAGRRSSACTRRAGPAGRGRPAPGRSPRCGQVRACGGPGRRGRLPASRVRRPAARGTAPPPERGPYPARVPGLWAPGRGAGSRSVRRLRVPTPTPPHAGSPHAGSSPRRHHPSGRAGPALAGHPGRRTAGLRAGSAGAWRCHPMPRRCPGRRALPPLPRRTGHPGRCRGRRRQDDRHRVRRHRVRRRRAQRSRDRRCRGRHRIGRGRRGRGPRRPRPRW